MDVQIRPLRQEDLARVAEIHVAAFPKSRLSRLGDEVVRRYYRWQLCGPHDAIAVAAVTRDLPVGFCFAGRFRGAWSGFVNANWAYLGWRLALRPWLLDRRAVTQHLLWVLHGRVYRRSERLGTAEPPRPTKRSFGVLAVAVHPDWQRRGIGSRLMRVAERAAVDQGFSRMNLTVATDNAPAIASYLKAGWVQTRTGLHWTGGMHKVLGGDRTAGVGRRSGSTHEWEAGDV